MLMVFSCFLRCAKVEFVNIDLFGVVRENSGAIDDVFQGRRLHRWHMLILSIIVDIKQIHLMHSTMNWKQNVSCVIYHVSL